MRLLLLHGWGGNAPQRLIPLADQLRAKGYDVFQPHMPGFGLHEPPDLPWGVDDYMKWIKDEVDKRGWDTFAVAGFSFGGRVAMHFTSQYSDRVQKLILIAASGIKRPLSFKTKVVSFAGRVGKRIFSLPGLLFLQPVIHSIWRRLLKRKDYYRATVVMQKTFIKVIQDDLREIIPTITKQTLIIWGKKDLHVPVQDAYYMNEHIKNSELKIFSQADHLVAYEYPEEVAEEIDNFLMTQ